ncbi:hydrolase [Aureimonas ureilytica]|uniref:Hydrolase n=1 Tax=Aureimonas ureilytica TaxID=401562 RepID=A0A175RB86_9HYPH|nr:amidohydrolase family protein [Aureimonas ureilytica]KTQ97146.1 hydrolase [Aureimonas ureilytica]
MSRYAGPLIDPHHHLWDLSLKRHPWLEARPEAEEMVFGSIDSIRRDYLPSDYIRDANRQNIVATVHVEAGWRDDDPLGETLWLERQADHRIARRLVARVPLAHLDAEARLEAEAARPRVVGIRDIVSWDADPAKRFALRPGLMSDPAWRRGLKAVTRLGLSFDLMLYPPQMAEAQRLAADFPNTLFVLNHCGSPADRSADGMRLWAEGLRDLARAPNVRLKLSDPVAYDPDWTLHSLRAVIRHGIDCFGADRAMFASDFPVTGLHASFDAIYEAFRTIVADLTMDEQAALFFDTANRTYRLGLDRSAFSDSAFSDRIPA